MCAGGHKARLLSADLLLAACQDPSYTVGLEQKIDKAVMQASITSTLDNTAHADS